MDQSTLDYITLLKDPFSDTPVKIRDGSVSNSSAVKLRTTGVFIVPVSGVFDLRIIPCVSNVIDASGQTRFQTVPPDHIDTIYPRVLKSLYHRLVNVGVRFRLAGSDTLYDDGYWEAVRIPVIGVGNYDFNVNAQQWRYTLTTPLTTNLALNPTFQTGKLRDLDKYLFKLNTENNNFEFNSDVIKKGFDMIYIKIYGRRSGDTRIHWNAVSNQEVVYSAGTIFSNYHTPCDAGIPYMKYVSALSRFQRPGVEYEGQW